MMHYEKTHHPGFTVVGIACRVSNARPEAIDALWQRFLQEKILLLVLGRTSDAVYALYCDYETDHNEEYTMVLGYEVPANALVATEPPEGLVVAVVPASRYALIEARGKQPETLVKVWKQVWASAMERTYICDFEVHWGPVAVEVYVGIEAEN